MIGVNLLSLNETTKLQKGIPDMKRKQSAFTLIELPVSSAVSSLHFFTHKSACETKQRSPLFLKEKGGAGKGKTFFLARSAGCEKTRPSVFVSLRRDESLRWGSDISSQRSPLFIRRYYRNLSDYTDSAHAVCLSYFDCCCKASNQTVRDAPSQL